jgi:hypothetical protein
MDRAPRRRSPSEGPTVMIRSQASPATVRFVDLRSSSCQTQVVYPAALLKPLSSCSMPAAADGKSKAVTLDSSTSAAAAAVVSKSESVKGAARFSFKASVAGVQEYANLLASAPVQVMVCPLSGGGTSYCQNCCSEIVTSLLRFCIDERHVDRHLCGLCLMNGVGRLSAH